MISFHRNSYGHRNSDVGIPIVDLHLNSKMLFKKIPKQFVKIVYTTYSQKAIWRCEFFSAHTVHRCIIYVSFLQIMCIYVYIIWHPTQGLPGKSVFFNFHISYHPNIRIVCILYLSMYTYIMYPTYVDKYIYYTYTYTCYTQWGPMYKCCKKS